MTTMRRDSRIHVPRSPCSCRSDGTDYLRQVLPRMLIHLMFVLLSIDCFLGIISILDRMNHSLHAMDVHMYD